MSILDDIFTDEQSLVTALGILKSSTSSDLEKFFKAAVALLTAELEDRRAALPPPEPAPVPEPIPSTANKAAN
jgi:hypothetical protein